MYAFRRHTRFLLRPPLASFRYSGVTDTSRGAGTCETIFHTRKQSETTSCVSSLSRDTRRPVASVSSTKDSIGRSWLAESRASRTEHASEKTRRRREPYWRRSLTTLPLLAWRPSDCSTSRALCIYRRYIDIRATQSPRFLSRRRRRRHARGRDRHVSSHVSAGALRREAACWRQELKAQASVWRVSFCKDSAPGPRSMLIVTTRLNRFDPI